MNHTAPLAILLVLVAASSPAYADASANIPTAQVPPQQKNCVPSSSVRQPSNRPPIRVCVGDSDTQLNLPWFVTDVLTAVDTRQSPRALLHRMRDDF
ncbi:hypothetical protein QZM46_03825 [Burkholderia vietnamiensis]|jgi:hypothetical protein|uniref:Secreted protein n=4 Tax=Burkholderia cepacia complex TaxID=87882 RepID=A4JKS1_BURVG|nr:MULTISPECIES: hypothetical protein [Burkholderia]ABO56874.1 conserved hypothetical protein [Burkholderia vietnamiensis G4]AFJ87912.1 hypothetical protein MYA_3554 [Burkholderia sp. KJ006]AJY05034.1 hypothetical protein AK36_4819 [Burkholderia vietnamiensis LMG 10929]AOJ77492.1 hypothetical protein WJ35_20525 [Burkholderia ubonensis]AOJ97851.1 hypothetical protein WK23_03850 [Burkholderia vietnamiensis]